MVAEGPFGVRLLDVGIVLAVIALLEISVTVGGGEGAAKLDLRAYLLGAVIALPLLFRHRWPLRVLQICFVAIILYYSLDRRNISPAPLLGIPVYDVALAGDLAWAIAIPAIVMSAGLLFVGLSGSESAVALASNFYPSIVLFVMAVLLGEVVRGRRALAAETAERLRLQVTEERLRIARELHDTVAHSMATIAVQAGSALHLISQNDIGSASPLNDSLRAIRQTSKSALSDMRLVLGQLRGDAPVDGHGPGLLPAGIAGAQRDRQRRRRQRRGQRARDHGHAGTGRRRGRHADRGPPRRRLLRGVRPAADRGASVIRVLLADDQALLRAGFRLLLDSAEDIEVVGEADNGGVAVAMAREHRPDVVLMDLRMPEVDGVTATSLISGDPALAGVRVVALTTFDDDETVFSALRAGASGFLVKDIEPDELLKAIRVVARGDALLSPSVTRAVIAAFTAGGTPVTRPSVSPLTSLTEREREVVGLVAAGLSNDEIAARLVVSPLTAKTHVSRAMTKAGARDRAQLVVFAYEHGLTAR